MRKHFMVTALLFTSVSMSVFAQVNDDAVIAEYRGSTELPDEIAYAQFLNLVDVTGSSQSGQDAYLHTIAKALGYENLHSGDQTVSIERLSAVGSFFRQQFREMKLEEIDSKLRVLCQPSNNRQATELYDAVNSSEDVANAVRTKHLAYAINWLTSSERQAFRSYLREFKQQVTYVRVDAKRWHGDKHPSNGNIHDAVASTCEEYQADYQRLLEAVE